MACEGAVNAGEEQTGKQTMEDLRWGLRLGDVVQLTPRNTRAKKREFALYCGRGRVVHSWSPTRRDFRIRIDALRTLDRAGYEVSECSTRFDAYCHDEFASFPLETKAIILRAKKVMHMKTKNASASLAFILWARYGDGLFSLAWTLKEGFNANTGTYEMKASPNGHVPVIDDACNKNSSEETMIQALLGSFAEPMISFWLANSLGDFLENAETTQERPHEPNRAPQHSHSDAVPILMMYDKIEAQFMVTFRMDLGLPLRLLRMAGDCLECGICNSDFTKTKVMLLWCTHFICGPCLKALHYKVCPYCRAQIIYAAEVAWPVKMVTRKLMAALVPRASATTKKSCSHTKATSVTL